MNVVSGILAIALAISGGLAVATFALCLLSLPFNFGRHMANENVEWADPAGKFGNFAWKAGIVSFFLILALALCEAIAG